MRVECSDDNKNSRRAQYQRVIFAVKPLILVKSDDRYQPEYPHEYRLQMGVKFQIGETQRSDS